MNKLSSQDRSSLIRLASSLPVGSEERKVILAGLAQTQVASGEFNIPGQHILEGAQVTENAKVFDGAQAFGRAQVGGKAKVYGKASVSDRAHVYGMAQVYGEALVYGNAKVTLHANVSGDARVYGNATVAGQAMITGHAKVSGKAVVMGKAKVFGRANISGSTVIYGGNWDGSEGEITSGSWEGPGIPVEGARLASGNAKEIAKDIWETFIFERELSSSERPFNMRKIEKAVAEMLSEGAVFDDKGVKILAGATPKEREEHYGEYEGFYDLDDALYRDGPQDY